MVKKIGEQLILNDLISVDLVSGHRCEICLREIESTYRLCKDCYYHRPTFSKIIVLGDYYPKWWNRNDAFIQTYNNFPKFEDVNPKYRFSKLVNDAKDRNTNNSVEEKKELIQLACDDSPLLVLPSN